MDPSSQSSCHDSVAPAQNSRPACIYDQFSRTEAGRPWPVADRAAHCPCRLGIQIASSHHALLDAAHTTVSTSVAAAGVSNSAGCNTGPGWSSIIRNDAAAEERGGCEELCRRVAAPAALQRASPSFHSTAASARASEVDKNAAPCVLREARSQDGWQRPACFNATELVRH